MTEPNSQFDFCKFQKITWRYLFIFLTQLQIRRQQTNLGGVMSVETVKRSALFLFDYFL